MIKSIKNSKTNFHQKPGFSESSDREREVFRKGFRIVLCELKE